MGARPCAYLMYGYRLLRNGHWEVAEAEDGSITPMTLPWFAEGLGKGLVDEEGWVDEKDFIDAADTLLRAYDLNPKTKFVHFGDGETSAYLVHGEYEADWDDGRLLDPVCFEPASLANLSLSMALDLLKLTPKQERPVWILAADYS